MATLGLGSYPPAHKRCPDGEAGRREDRRGIAGRQGEHQAQLTRDNVDDGKNQALADVKISVLR